ncbi:MAG: Spy/CpxP family protein refolding chaperone [Polaribacter sp.]|jgi:Spy/CpxP family protein refolding chaperone
MIMNRKTILISITAGLFAIGSMAIANPNHKMRHGGYDNHVRQAPNAKNVMKLLSKLDLSDEQRVEIKALIQNGMESTKAQRETLKSMHHQMKALTQAEAVDETGIKSLTLEMANLKSDLMIARLNKHHQISSLLNDEQKEKMDKMKQHRIKNKGQ